MGGHKKIGYKARSLFLEIRRLQFKPAVPKFLCAKETDLLRHEKPSVVRLPTKLCKSWVNARR